MSLQGQELQIGISPVTESHPCHTHLLQKQKPIVCCVNHYNSAAVHYIDRKLASWVSEMLFQKETWYLLVYYGTGIILEKVWKGGSELKGFVSEWWICFL